MKSSESRTVVKAVVALAAIVIIVMGGVVITALNNNKSQSSLQTIVINGTVSSSGGGGSGKVLPPPSGSACPASGLSQIQASVNYENYGKSPFTSNSATGINVALYSPSYNNGTQVIVNATYGTSVLNVSKVSCGTPFSEIFGINQEGSFYEAILNGTAANAGTTPTSMTVYKEANPAALFQNATTTSTFGLHAHFRGVANGSVVQGKIQLTGGSGWFGAGANGKFVVAFGWSNTTALTGITVGSGYGAQTLATSAVPSTLANIHAVYSFPSLNYSQVETIPFSFHIGNIPSNIITNPVNISVSFIPETMWNQNSKVIYQNVAANPLTGTSAGVFLPITFNNSFSLNGN